MYSSLEEGQAFHIPPQNSSQKQDEMPANFQMTVSLFLLMQLLFLTLPVDSTLELVGKAFTPYSNLPPCIIYVCMCVYLNTYMYIPACIHILESRGGASQRPKGMWSAYDNV